MDDIHTLRAQELQSNHRHEQGTRVVHSPKKSGDKKNEEEKLSVKVQARYRASA